MSIYIIILQGQPGFFTYQEQEHSLRTKHLFLRAQNFGTLFQIQFGINPHILVLVEGSKKFLFKNINLQLPGSRMISNIFSVHTFSLSPSLFLPLSVPFSSSFCPSVVFLNCAVLSCLVLFCWFLSLSCPVQLCLVPSSFVLSCPAFLVLLVYVS